MQLDAYLSEKHKRRRKRRRYAYGMVVFVCVALVLIGAAWFTFRSPFIRIAKIQVTGNNAVPADAVVSLLQSSVLRDHNFWRSLLGINNILIWPDSLPASDLGMVPQLASVSISKDYFSRTVTAQVTERTPTGIWCYMGNGGITADESCYSFDGNGVLFERTFDTQGGAIFAIHDYSQKDSGLLTTILPAEFVPDLISIMDVLRASGAQVNEIALKNLELQQMDVALTGGPALYFSLRFPADGDLAVLRELMAKPNFNKLQYVDFTVENRAYYK